MPLHLRAAELVRSGIYADVVVFAELESRIATLRDEKAKGDAFEVFAEAYLATQRKHDAEKVWPLSATALESLQRLGLSHQDYGVDGIFLTLLGHYNAYQVKFRSVRSRLLGVNCPRSWAWQTAHTFIAES